MSIVESWLADQTRSSTRRQFRHHFTKYWTWIEREELFSSLDALLHDYEEKTGRDRYTHIELLKRYFRYLRNEVGYSINSRRTALTAIRNFYMYNHTPLPKLTRQDLRGMLEPTENEIQKKLNVNPVSLEDLRDTLLATNEPYRTIFQILYQSGMGLAEFQYFNQHGWTQIKDQLDQDGPIKINLFRRKTSEAHVHTYYTFLGEEGKEAIKRWLRIREAKYGPPQDDEPLFITIQKKNGVIGAPATVTIQQNLIRAMKRAGIVPVDATGPYDLHPHELRDMFKSMCTLAGVNKTASEFFLGHSIDPLGYDKSPKYDVAWFQREYQKVEPRLTLFSETMNRDDMKKEVALEAIRRFGEAFGIDSMKIRIEKQLELGRSLDSEEEIQLITNTIKKLREPEDDPQIIVAEGELETYLQDGWEFVSVLPSQKILIRK
jgi:site-specific recombinase XerD